MKIGIACGGTGGHIFPGLATAEVLRSRGHEITLWLAGKSVESAAASGWQGPVVTVAAEGLDAKLTLHSVVPAWRLVRAIRACVRVMREQPVDVLLAMGSYASVGPVGAALRCGIPFVLHESNVIPGRAVKLFARRATAVAGSFEETGYYLKRRDLVLTGMPLRGDLEAAAHAAREAPVSPREFTLLVMGGSGGAQTLNSVVPAALRDLAGERQRIRIVHLAGRADESAVREAYAKSGIAAVVHGFTHEMAAIYREASFAICRAGAATCAELGAFGIPALLVPYPFAVGDHQTANARSLEKIGAADVIADQDLTPAWLAAYLAERIGRPERLEQMRRAAGSRLRWSGAQRLADLVEQIGGRPRGRPAPGSAS